MGAFLFALGMLFGCAHYPVNQRLETVKKYQDTDLYSRTHAKDTFAILAFSGGGTRAAALSYGVLEALDKVKIPVPAHAADVGDEEDFYSLLNEVDVIYSVSGGSFTSAYYALYGDRIFDDFKERFLYYNVQGGLLWRLFSPVNIIRLGSLYYGRSELAADYYDKLLFNGATFGDIWARGGPEIMIQATDIADGIRFSFSRYYFALICSDLSSFPVSRAVAASAAFPGPFTPIRLVNYAGTCGFEEESWITEALEKRDLTSRTYYTANELQFYRDSKRKARIHLLDGGITDNIGLRGPIEMIAGRGGIRESLKLLGRERETRRVVFIVVNAEGETSNPWGLTDALPGLGSMLGAT